MILGWCLSRQQGQGQLPQGPGRGGLGECQVPVPNELLGARALCFCWCSLEEQYVHGGWGPLF